MKQEQQGTMSKKSAAEMTVEEFAIELMLMWDDVITIEPSIKTKSTRTYLTQQRGDFFSKVRNVGIKRRNTKWQT